MSGDGSTAAGHRHRLTAAMAAVTLTLGVTYVIAQGEPSTTNLTMPYAYLTASQLGLVRGGHVAVKVAGVFGTEGGLITTLDGQYVAAISEPSEASINADDVNGSRHIVAINVTSGAVSTFSCVGCTNIVAAGGSTLAASLGDTSPQSVAVLTLDLATRHIPARLPTNLVALDTGPNLLVGLPGEVFATGGDDYTGTNQLGPLQSFILHLDGTAVEVPGIDGNMGVLAAAATTHGQSGGPQVALAGAWRRSANDTCSIGGFVSIVDPTSGDVTLTNTSAIVPEGRLIGTAANAETGLLVQDLWWSVDGYLHATVSIWRCQPESSQTFPGLQPATEWRLADGRWQQVSKAHVDDVRELGDGARAELVGSSTTGLFESGTLYFVNSAGQRIVVANYVKQLVTPVTGRSG